MPWNASPGASVQTAFVRAGAFLHITRATGRDLNRHSSWLGRNVFAPTGTTATAFLGCQQEGR